MCYVLACYEAGIYLFNVNNENTKKISEIYPKLTIKIPKPSQWRRSGVFTVSFEQISHIFFVFSLLALNKRTSVGKGVRNHKACSYVFNATVIDFSFLQLHKI